MVRNLEAMLDAGFEFVKEQDKMTNRKTPLPVTPQLNKDIPQTKGTPKLSLPLPITPAVP
jgi:hypothetical protein